MTEAHKDPATPLDPLVAAIVKARKEQKLTQEQIAEAAGLSRRALVMIEAGGDCNLSTLRRLLDAAGLDAQAVVRRMPTLEDVTKENNLEFFESVDTRQNFIRDRS